MPYINKEIRSRKKYDTDLEDKINDIIYSIKDLCNPDEYEGVCNYTISRIIAGVMKPETGWRYMWLNRAYGTFMSAAAEFYRRLIVPYEDLCIKTNEDIPEYDNK